MKCATNQILLYTSHRWGGWADCLDVPQDQSVAKLFHETMAGQPPEDFLVRVNRQPVGSDTVLQDGDRVTITPLKLVTLLAFLGIGSLQAFAKPFAKGPYLGQTPPGPVAQVFAPGLISDTRPHRWESHGHFSANGNTFCFRRRGYVHITENTEHGWTTPKRIRSIPYRSWSCCLAPDANSIYFLDQYFTRPARSRADPEKRRGYHRCLRTPQGWSWPRELGPPFTSAAGGFSMTAEGSLCFKSRQGGFRLAHLVGNTWKTAVRLPVEFGNWNPCHPGIAPDGSFLVFYSIQPGARGGTETNLYLTLRQPDGSWTKPRKMGPGVNTGYHETGARISPDRKYMFFTRSTGWNLNPATDTADIYWVELKEHLPESHR